MSIEVIGFSLDVLGTLMIAFTAIMVHHRVLKGHRIDRKVFLEMRREQVIGVLGIFLILLGYVLQLSFKL